MRIIAGEARGRIIEAPDGRHTRPTLDRIRENLFNMIQSDIPGSRVLDLFAGSGSLSLEALSRGAASAVLVDSDRNAFMTEQKNIQTLRYHNRTRLFHCDWHAAVRQLSGEQSCFDIVFLDPPYAMTDLIEVFDAIAPVITDESLVVLEHEAEKNVKVSASYNLLRSRSWGFCAISFYTLQTGV